MKQVAGVRHLCLASVLGCLLGCLVGCGAPKEASSEPKASEVAVRDNAPGPAVQQEQAKPVKKSYTPEELVREVGIKSYPGAEAPDMMSRVPLEMPSGERRYELVLATKDAEGKVVAWYEKELGLTSMKLSSGRQLVGRVDGKDLMIGIGPESGQTFIRIQAIVYPKKQ